MRYFLLALFVFSFACTSKVEGNIKLDGANFMISECRSGQINGFYGMIFNHSDGRSIRLYGNTDGSANVVLFKKKDDGEGKDLGACAKLSMYAQSSRINSIQNMKGTATFNCNSLGNRVEGQIQFENCH